MGRVALVRKGTTLRAKRAKKTPPPPPHNRIVFSANDNHPLHSCSTGPGVWHGAGRPPMSINVVDPPTDASIKSSGKLLKWNVAMPVIHVYAINSTAPKDPALYDCPTYKKPQRTDLTFISSLYLKSKQHPSKWVLRGVALLCDIK